MAMKPKLHLLREVKLGQEIGLSKSERSPNENSWPSDNAQEAPTTDGRRQETPLPRSRALQPPETAATNHPSMMLRRSEAL